MSMCKLFLNSNQGFNSCCWFHLQDAQWTISSFTCVVQTTKLITQLFCFKEWITDVYVSCFVSVFIVHFAQYMPYHAWPQLLVNTCGFFGNFFFFKQGQTFSTLHLNREIRCERVNIAVKSFGNVSNWSLCDPRWQQTNPVNFFIIWRSSDCAIELNNGIRGSTCCVIHAAPLTGHGHEFMRVNCIRLSTWKMLVGWTDFTDLNCVSILIAKQRVMSQYKSLW